MPGGQGRGIGAGQGRSRNNRMGAGPGGECLCPKCGKTIPHRQGQPCSKEICLECGANMTRAGQDGY